MHISIRYLPGLALCFCLGSAVAQPQAPVFTVGQIAGDPADMLELPIDVGGEFAAAQFDLVLSEPRLSLNGFTPAALPAGLALDYAIVAPDHLRLVLYQTACPVPTAGAGGQAAGMHGVAVGQRLGSAVVTIASDATPGSVAVALTGLKVVDEAAAPLVAQQVEGQIAIRGGGVPPVAAIPVPTLPLSGLLAMFALLLVAGLVVLHRRGVNVLLVLITAGLVLATQPQPAAAGQGGGGADAASIVDVILERQSPDGSEDCNGDGLIDVGDVICARNMACEAGQNQPPVIAAIADQSLTVGESFGLQVQASDPDPGDTLSFTLATAPAGMGIDGNGLISWTPSSGDLGAHPVTIEVADPLGLSASESFTLTVMLPVQDNGRPVLEGIADRRVPAGTLVVINPTASDPDAGDTLSFVLTDAPAGMTINAASGQIRWTPDNNQIGASLIGVEVSDADGLADRRLFRITVIDGGPPVLDAIADQGARADVPFSLTVTATDPDAGDRLAFSLDHSPVGMSLNPGSGNLDWTPAPAQLGNHSVGVTVTDSTGLSDSATFSISVGQARPPVAVDDAYQAVKGDTLTIAAPGVLANDSDPNNDPLTAVLETGPSKGSLALNADGSFEYTPDSPAGTLSAVEKFRQTGVGGLIAQPLIMDMDGDGVPEIIYQSHSKLGALRGDTMSKVFEVSIARSLWGEKAIADIDLDGHPDIIVIGREDGHTSTEGGKKLIALEHDGQVKWISESLPDRFRGAHRIGVDGFLNSKVSIADLDQDGTPEIVVGWGHGSPVPSVGYSVFDNQGMLLDTVMVEGIPSTQSWGRTEIVDLDLDGKPEIVTGSVAFRHDGELLWARNDVTQNNKSVYTPIAANLDDDPYPELVRRVYISHGADNIVAWNHDGTDLWQATMPFTVGNEPLVLADLNNNGLADVLATSHADRSVTALNGADGTLLWRYQLDPSSVPGFSAATVIDLDGDGFNEVVYPYGRGPVRLLILDGRDGSLKLDQELCNCPYGPGVSIPIFADIDGDGASELIVKGFSLSPSLFVFESENDDWPPTRGVWNQWDYHVTNINADGSVPQFEQPHWLLPGLNRNRVNELMPEERHVDTDSFTYRADDGDLQSNLATVSIEILPPVNPPRILSQPRLFASPGFEYVYPLLAVDPDPGETLTYALTEAPAGMSIDANGIIRWMPASADLGERLVAVRVSDSLGLAADQTWTLAVQAPVTVPAIVNQPRAEAESAITDARLSVGNVARVFDDAVPIGRVISQTPAAGTTAAAGSPVDFHVSLGPPPVRVPNVVGLSQDSAEDLILATGLVVGTVTPGHSDTIPAGVVIAQGQAPGSDTNAGASLDITVSVGARIRLSLESGVVLAGESTAFSVAVFDSNGAQVSPTPAYLVEINAEPDAAAGLPPQVVAGTITTGGDTLGAYTVTATLVASSEAVSEAFAVVSPAGENSPQSIFVDLAARIEELDVLTRELSAAIEAGDQGAIGIIHTDLLALQAAIELEDLRVTSPFAPDGGFPPPLSELPPAGFDQSAADIAYVGAVQTLVDDLKPLELLLADLSPTTPGDDDARLRDMNQQVAESIDRMSSLEPTLYGQLAGADWLSHILSVRIPRLVHAQVTAIDAALTDAGLVSQQQLSRAGKTPGLQRAATPPPPAQPQFFSLGGLMTGSALRTRLIKKIYVPLIQQLLKSGLILAGEDLLKQYANAGELVGVISAGSVSIHIFDAPNSVIEGLGLNGTLPEASQVLMVGPDAINAVQDAITNLGGIEIKNLNDLQGAFKTIADAARSVEDAFNKANSTPKATYRGCLFDPSPDCLQLIYPDGFASVYKSTGLPIPAPVLIVVRNVSTGNFDVTLANFVPTQPGD